MKNTEEKTLEITRKDFVDFHNGTIQALTKLVTATNDERGMTAEETMEVFKLLYPVIDKMQNIAIENNFGFCI